MSSVASPETAAWSVWQFDPVHTLVEFSARHMMVTTVKGRFAGVKGTIVDVEDDPSSSSVEVEIDAASVTTGEPKRDAHLRSADFLDVEHYPTIVFKSTRIEGNRDQFALFGDLTIRDRTREVRLEATFNGRGKSPYGKVLAGFSAQTEINRREWGLTWNVPLEAGGVMVGDRLKIQMEVEAVRQST